MHTHFKMVNAHIKICMWNYLTDKYTSFPKQARIFHWETTYQAPVLVQKN